jgi:uncharacterized protein
VTLKKNIEELRTKNKTQFEFSEVLNDVKIEGLNLSDVNVEYLIELVGQDVIVRGEYNAKAEATCVRCLEKVELEVSGEFFGDYKNSEDYKRYLDELGKEAQISGDEIEELVNDEVDITSLVRDYIILNMPQFPICDPICDGLEEMEKYSNNGIDPRWQQLLDLKN